MPETQPIVVINCSTLDDDEVRHYVAALQMFLPTFLTWWPGPEVDLAFAPHGQRIPKGLWVQVVADDSRQVDALGYHETTEHGYPIGYTFVRRCRESGSLVSGTLSHELWEMLGDPMIDRVVVDQRTGRRWDVENADAVEADEYGITVPMPSGPPVTLSDFVTPAYFGIEPLEPAPDGRFDYRGLLTEPLPAMLPGGYLAYQEPSGAWGQIDRFERDTRARAAARPHLLSRRYRRMFRTWQDSDFQGP